MEWAQPTEAPPFDQSLVGKRIEVLWRYFEKGADKQHLIWSSGRVVRIADGLTDKRSSKAHTVLPGGAVLWAWDADPEFEEVAGEQCGGWCCCRRSGTPRPRGRCTAGGMTPVSLEPRMGARRMRGARTCVE